MRVGIRNTGEAPQVLRAMPWRAVPLPVAHALSQLRQMCLAKCVFT